MILSAMFCSFPLARMGFSSGSRTLKGIQSPSISSMPSIYRFYTINYTHRHTFQNPVTCCLKPSVRKYNIAIFFYRSGVITSTPCGEEPGLASNTGQTSMQRFVILNLDIIWYQSILFNIAQYSILLYNIIQFIGGASTTKVGRAEPEDSESWAISGSDRCQRQWRFVW